ncbi:MAG TPA: dihydroorotate dehydrogenase electron transfer subunit, partial [Thermoguttaceae bacterium]|nr:dihydroorotate dehydrogenase electron transfer subunit [Thermoguttaceae bacterium]
MGDLSSNRPWQGMVVVVENVRVADDTYRVRFRAPEIARRIVPGQFLMMRLPGTLDPLLGRPLAVYDVTDEAGEPALVDIVYLVVGHLTGLLAAIEPGTLLEVWGPLGNGFSPEPVGHLIMVAGGIGQTPFLALAREYLGGRTFGDPPRRAAKADRVTLCYGARTASRLACVEDFRRSGVEVRVATDDGTEGHHGLVTELIRPVVEESTVPCRIVSCGPEPMLAAVARVAKELGVPCQVSLESPMACGMGICFSCVTKIRDGRGGWDYRRTCVDGPIFNAEDVEF